LQKTPLDSQADMVIHGLCDDVMRLLLAKLGLEITPFKLKRRMRVAIIEKNEQKCLLIEGIDHDGAPYSLFTQVDIAFGSQGIVLTQEPYCIFLCTAKGTPYWNLPGHPKIEISLEMRFQGNYQEPNLTFSFPLEDFKEKIITMEFDPMKEEQKQWENVKQIA